MKIYITYHNKGGIINEEDYSLLGNFHHILYN